MKNLLVSQTNNVTQVTLENLYGEFVRGIATVNEIIENETGITFFSEEELNLSTYYEYHDDYYTEINWTFEKGVQFAMDLMSDFSEEEIILPNLSKIKNKSLARR